MNNSYLVRGLAKETREWVIGYYLGECCGSVVIVPPNEVGYDCGGYIDDTQGYECIPETVGKCMGAKDRKNCVIFEGDVLARFDTPTKPQYVVLWDSEKFAWTIKSFDGFTTVTATQSNCHALVICGNRFEYNLNIK